MAFTEEEKIVIKFLRQNRKYGAKRLLREYPDKGWTLGGLSYLLQKIDKTGSSKRQPGSGRSRSEATKKNIDQVRALICSRQKDDPKLQLSQRAIARQLGIPQTTMNRVVMKELIGCKRKVKRSTKMPTLTTTTKTVTKTDELTQAKKKLRFQRVRQLLKRYPADTVNSIWFTNQKIFTLAAPADGQTKSALGNLKTVVPPKSVMVSAGVSAIGKTKIHIIEPGVKVNGDYYRDVMLMKNLLPDIRVRSSGPYTFQQDNAPARIGPKTVELLQNETPDFIHPTIWPTNSPDLNPLDYKIWGIIEDKVYESKVKGVKDLRERIIKAWNELDIVVIGTAINEWLPRLAACAKASGGHFEDNFHANTCSAGTWSEPERQPPPAPVMQPPQTLQERQPPQPLERPPPAQALERQPPQALVMQLPQVPAWQPPQTPAAYGQYYSGINLI